MLGEFGFFYLNVIPIGKFRKVEERERKVAFFFMFSLLFGYRENNIFVGPS